jgi:hypothetical protein
LGALLRPHLQRTQTHGPSEIQWVLYAPLCWALAAERRRDAAGPSSLSTLFLRCIAGPDTAVRARIPGGHSPIMPLERTSQIAHKHCLLHSNLTNDICSVLADSRCIPQALKSFCNALSNSISIRKHPSPRLYSASAIFCILKLPVLLNVVGLVSKDAMRTAACRTIRELGLCILESPLTSLKRYPQHLGERAYLSMAKKAAFPTFKKTLLYDTCRVEVCVALHHCIRARQNQSRSWLRAPDLQQLQHDTHAPGRRRRLSSTSQRPPSSGDPSARVTAMLS